MNLIAAIQLQLPAATAIVGAGGKTTALFQLAQQVDGLAWVTTTTHLGTDQTGLADRHFVIEPDPSADFNRFTEQKVTLITGPSSVDNRLKAPAAGVLEQMRIFARRKGISLFIEADGARSLPLKAPAQHEPAIPPWAEQVIVVVGLSVLGRPFGAQWVHRPEYFASITGLAEGDRIDIQSISRLLSHPEGGRKNVPPQAKLIALLNQADTEAIRQQARDIAPALITHGYSRVVVGSVGREPDKLEVFCNV